MAHTLKLPSGATVEVSTSARAQTTVTRSTRVRCCTSPRAKASGWLELVRRRLAAIMAVADMSGRVQTAPQAQMLARIDGRCTTSRKRNGSRRHHCGCSEQVRRRLLEKCGATRRARLCKDVPAGTCAHIVLWRSDSRLAIHMVTATAHYQLPRYVEGTSATTLKRPITLFSYPASSASRQRMRTSC